VPELLDWMDDITDRTEYRRIAVFGRVYNNAPALQATLEDARRREVEAVFSFLPEVPQVLHERASHGKPCMWRDRRLIVGTIARL